MKIPAHHVMEVESALTAEELVDKDNLNITSHGDCPSVRSDNPFKGLLRTPRRSRRGHAHVKVIKRQQEQQGQLFLNVV